LRTITIIVSKEGHTRIEATGFEGGDCRLASEKLRQALGEQLSEQLKPEFAMQPQGVPIPLQTSGGPFAR
jgi:Protein of unknown function (DUF2997)